MFHPHGDGMSEANLITPSSSVRVGLVWRSHIIAPLTLYLELVNFLYILHSLKDNNFYTGITTDLDRRTKEHLAGKNISTSYRRPLKLIYYEAYLLKSDAEARERYLKTSMGRRVIRKQLSHYLKLRQGEKNKFNYPKNQQGY